MTIMFDFQFADCVLQYFYCILQIHNEANPDLVAVTMTDNIPNKLKIRYC